MNHDGHDAVGLGNRFPRGLGLSVPWNHDQALLERLEPFAPHMANIYLPFHPSIGGASRVWAGPEDEASYRDEVDAVAAWTAARDIGLVMVTNIPGRVIQGEALVAEVQRVAPSAARLRLTFADAVVAARLKDRLLPNADIGVSVLANVTNATQALYWKEATGASFITVAREINRRPAVLADIKSLGLRTGVVTCDECIPHCPFYSHHLRSSSANSFAIRNCSPEAVCIFARRPWIIAQKEILPGHLHHLEGLVDEVKLPGREQPTDKLVALLTSYLKARSMVHPHGYYEEPADLWEITAGCDRRCHDCETCAEKVHMLKDEAQVRAIKLGSRRPSQRPKVQRAKETSLPAPPSVPGTPAAPWRFVRADGRLVEVWLEPTGHRRPLRSVSGLGVYYRCAGPELPSVDALIAAVADALESAGVDDMKAPPELTPPPGGWPGGLVIK